MDHKKVTILCSGFGLGFYIPGLLVRTLLKKEKLDVATDVFENYMQSEKKEKINSSKKAYHDNFSMALLVQRIPIDIRESLDYNKIDKLLAQWEAEDRRHFIVLSGHWVYIMDAYGEKMGEKSIHVDLLYVDSALSPSWKGLKKYNPTYNETYHDSWLFNAKTMTIPYRIPVGEETPIPYEEREDRFVIHGGGWGMGTYQNKIPELQKLFELDVVAYEMHETENRKKGNRYFINKPSWNPWDRGPTDYEFPPFSQVVDDAPVFSNRQDYHRLYDVIRSAKAIISKPGAGTLIDSLASATPIIMVDCFGAHEKKNYALWEKMGYGIPYEKWEASGYDMGLLEELHNNLLTTMNEPKHYARDYIARYALA